MAKHDKRVKYENDAEKPVMLSLRVPRELNDRLERYASEHRQKVSELVRDAIEMRLEVDADPRSLRAYSPTAETREQRDGASLLRDMQATLARHDTQMHALMQATFRQTTPAGNGMADSVSCPVIHSHTDVEPVETQAPAFDPEKYHLGKLCPSKHAWGSTGQSLRNDSNQCLACKARAKRDKDARKRAERQVLEASAD